MRIPDHLINIDSHLSHLLFGFGTGERPGGRGASHDFLAGTMNGLGIAQKIRHVSDQPRRKRGSARLGPY